MLIYLLLGGLALVAVGLVITYNGLVQSWPEIVRLSREGGKPRAEQGVLFGETEE